MTMKLKLIMRNAILFILLFLGQFSYGQNCQYEVNHIDKFTKQKNLQTKFEDCATTTYTSEKTGSKMKNVSVSLQRIDKMIRLLLKCKFAVDYSQFVYGNIDMTLLLSNDSIIRLTGLYSEVTREYTYTTVIFELNETSQMLLKSAHVTDIRFVSTSPKTALRQNESSDKIDFKPDVGKEILIGKLLQCVE